MPFSDTCEIFNSRMASFVEVCPISRKIWSPLKMDPHLEGAVEVHPFLQTNVKSEPLSLLLTSTQSLYFHAWNSWICFVNKNIKRFAEIENLDLIRFCVLPIPPKKSAFSLPVDNLITAGEKIWWQKNGIEIMLTFMTVVKETVNG